MGGTAIREELAQCGAGAQLAQAGRPQRSLLRLLLQVSTSCCCSLMITVVEREIGNPGLSISQLELHKAPRHVTTGHGILTCLIALPVVQPALLHCTCAQ